MRKKNKPPEVAVIIPCYKVKDTIIDVIRSIDLQVVSKIYCIDDACPQGSADLIEKTFAGDTRIKVVRHSVNGGVGAATMTGYQAAIEGGADIIVKVDGDGQMPTFLIPDLIAPIVNGEADYVKGNRFFDVEKVRQMPVLRLIGNAGLSFFCKLSSGYWNLFDPTNGFTAIESRVAAWLPFKKLHRRFFFEQDLLFRLNTIRARIVEFPMTALYGDEKSNLNEFYSLLTFPFLHLKNFLKRIGYTYFIRNFSIASVNFCLGLLLFFFGTIFGIIKWYQYSESGQFASSGTVMIAALPIILGIQLFLNFLSYDISMVPNETLHAHLSVAQGGEVINLRREK